MVSCSSSAVDDERPIDPATRSYSWSFSCWYSASVWLYRMLRFSCECFGYASPICSRDGAPALPVAIAYSPAARALRITYRSHSLKPTGPLFSVQNGTIESEVTDL